jgi:bifunctional DNA-binding transcriptional regulator/antitoxin component of YhaV-PrlF toxin-antitoxin module
MPQLAKGGKWVFGVSVVGRDGSILLPPEAMKEYGYKDGEKVILMNGSRTSGGFVVTVKATIEGSKIASIFKTAPGLMNFSIAEGEITCNRRRLFCWTLIKPGGYIVLPEKSLAAYGIKLGGNLVVGRGSNFGIAFLAKGPVWEFAVKHPAVEVFKRKED